MTRDPSPSKLAVILHADVAGSTALVQQDHELAHRRIRETFQNFAVTIEKFSGRVLEIRGDALLATFEHAADALSAALSFQTGNAADNPPTSEDLRPLVRVGIAIGEVVVADGTVTGAGVVQAQRVEQLADAGGVCVTSAVQDAIPKRLPFAFENLGEHSLKGFEYPVRIFKAEVRSGEKLPAAEIQRGKTASLPGRPTTILAAVLLAIAAIVVYRYVASPWIEGPASDASGDLSLPDRPSIAVLPFTNMSSDAEQEYFVDGMTDDLITDLSKISGLFVISRNSVFTYKGKTVDIEQVASELGVRYVIEGSVRKAGGQVRINAQLIDASTGGHVWAERYDGSYEDVFSLQDRVSSNIVATLAIRLAAGEQDQLARIDTASTEAYDAFLRGWEQYQRQRPESFVKAIELFEKAVSLDREYSRAYAALAATHWQVWKRYWHEKIGLPNAHEPRYLAEQYLAQAMQNPTSHAYQVSASIRAQRGQHEQAISDAERAIALDPNDADSYATFAGVLNLAGQPRVALEMMERAIRLNPHYPAAYLYEIGLARFGSGDFEAAFEALDKAVAINPDDRWASRLLIATLGHLGRQQEAEQVMQKSEASWRGFDPLSVRGVTFWYPFKNQADTARLAEGLRKAGLPE